MAGRLDYPVTWEIGGRSLTLNGHRGADGELVRAYLEHTYQLEAYDFSPLDIREQREGMHLLTGGDLGPANRQFRHVSLRGVMKAETPGDLEDMEAELFAAFDLDHAQLDAPTTFGLGRLVHSSPTQLSAPGIYTLVREGFECRPENYPISYERRGPRGYTRAFAVQLVTGYPYRLLYPAEAIVFSTAAGWSQRLPNWTTRHGGTSRLSFDVLLTMDVSPDADLTISDGTRSLVMDLSNFNNGGADLVRVDMWSKQLYHPASEDADLVGLGGVRTSDIDSFFDVPAGGVDVTVTHTTGIESITARYHQSRA
jgi:hypothetical protein